MRSTVGARTTYSNDSPIHSGFSCLQLPSHGKREPRSASRMQTNPPQQPYSHAHPAAHLGWDCRTWHHWGPTHGRICTKTTKKQQYRIPLTCHHVEARKSQVSTDQRVAMVTWYNENTKVKRVWLSGERRLKIRFSSTKDPGSTSCSQAPRFQ